LHDELNAATKPSVRRRIRGIRRKWHRGAPKPTQNGEFSSVSGTFLPRRPSSAAASELFIHNGNDLLMFELV